MLSSKESLRSALPSETRRPVSRANLVARINTERPDELFSTCPQSLGFDKQSYAPQVRKVAPWRERCGCTGILVYTDNSRLDPWLKSQIIVVSTDELSPLVAIQPV